MRADAPISPECDSQRYQAVLRISEAIAACREPEELATTLADEIGKFLHFDHLYFMVLKENSAEIEYLVWGKGPIPVPDLPMEDGPIWEAVRSGKPQHIADWDKEEHYPRFKEWAKKMRLGSGLRIPLTTPHRRLGAFGLSRDSVNPFSEEEISFLGLIGHVVAFALDDGLNLRRAQQQNDQLQLLLNLTNRITSNLEFRELLREISANIREVIHADAVTVVLPDAASEKFRVFALDFPHGKGVIKEELLITPSAAIKKALDTLKPVVIDTRKPNDLASAESDMVAAEGIKSFCNIPLANHGRALGILSIARTTETPFSPGDVDFLNRA
jgi:formate hydrogenlyase transcriptional activator